MQIGLGLSITSQLRFGAAPYAVNNFDPDFVLDFKNSVYKTGGSATTISSAVTHTRASSATMTNSSGNIVTVGNNVARTGHHTYNGSAWVNEGILHESEARTNLATNSGDLSSGWVKRNLGLTSIATGSPFGAYQSALVLSTGATEGQAYQIGKTLIQGSTYVGWAMAKYSAGSGWFTISMYDTTNQNKRAWFDLQNGVVGSKDTLIIDCGMIDYGDGWWLCWASKNAGYSSGGINFEITTGDGNFSRSANDEILIAGTQFELGSTPSSYIPTSGSSVTRAAETLTVPAANLPYSSTNMSIQMDGKMTSNNLTHIRWFEDADDAILLETGTNNFTFSQEAGGTVDTVTGGSFTSGNLLAFNTASRHGSGFINGAISGTALTANTTPSALPDLADNNLVLGYDYMGTIGKFRMWDEDLTDTGITEAST